MAKIEEAPWRNPENYKVGPIVKCNECGVKCHKTHWGKWCYECNIDRIERINKMFDQLQRDYGLKS